MRFSIWWIFIWRFWSRVRGFVCFFLLASWRHGKNINMTNRRWKLKQFAKIKKTWMAFKANGDYNIKDRKLSTEMFVCLFLTSTLDQCTNTAMGIQKKNVAFHTTYAHSGIFTWVGIFFWFSHRLFFQLQIFVYRIVNEYKITNTQIWVRMVDWKEEEERESQPMLVHEMYT